METESTHMFHLSFVYRTSFFLMTMFYKADFWVLYGFSAGIQTPKNNILMGKRRGVRTPVDLLGKLLF